MNVAEENELVFLGNDMVGCMVYCFFESNLTRCCHVGGFYQNHLANTISHALGEDRDVVAYGLVIIFVYQPTANIHVTLLKY